MSRAARSSTRSRRSGANTRGQVQPPDRHELYELAVQAPAEEARFLRALHPARPGTRLVLGEDFSGAGAIARAWVRLYPGSKAVCVDRDPEPIARLNRLAPQGGSIIARRCDVMKATDRVDLLADFNFAICERTTRADLLAYLRHARRRLRPRGLLAVDLYGGAHAYVLGESDQELRSPELGGVRYVWEQREADPATARVVNAMHFFVPERPGGRRRIVLRDAFVYHWRLWTIAEMRDAMAEAGFASTEVHDRLGGAVDANGDVYARPLADGEPLDEDYVVYVVGRVRAARRAARR